MSPAPHHVGSRQLAAWSFVAAQFALIAALVLLPAGDDWPVPAWLVLVGALGVVLGLVIMVVAALGLGRGLTAAPLPNAHAELKMSGLYGRMRHPIYSGLLLIAWSRALTSGSVWVAAAAALLHVLITAKARWEERRLVERFPEYRDYAAGTPRFLPRTRRRGSA